MQRLVRRFMAGFAAVAVALTLSPGPADGTVGKRITNGTRHSNSKCLDTRLLHATMSTCDNSVYQDYRYVEVSGNVWEIRVRHPGTTAEQCLGGAMGIEAQVYLLACNDRAARWIRISFAEPWHGWVNQEWAWANMCLAVRDFGRSPIVELNACSSTLGNYKWKMF